MKAEVALDRANRAQKLVDDPMLKEAFEIVRQTILQTMENAPIEADIQECRMMLKLLRSVRSHLEQAVIDGKVILATLEQKRRMSPADYAARWR